jgi:hypothetical protein
MKLAVFSLLLTAAGHGQNTPAWVAQDFTSQMDDKSYVIVMLEGEYIPAREEKPTIGLRCSKGKYVTAALTTSGPILAQATERLLQVEGGGFGLPVAYRFNEEKAHRDAVRVSRGSQSFALDGVKFGKMFVSAERYRIQFSIFPSGSLVADFYPSRADRSKVHGLCGFS